MRELYPIEHRVSNKTTLFIKVQTSPELCLRRIKSRDSSLHIPVSDDIVDKINQDASNVDIQHDLIIDNEKSTDREIIVNIKKII
jgi:hypothetical protein